MRSVLITIIYGFKNSCILRDVFSAAKELTNLGINPFIVQVFIPHARARVYVNDVEIDLSSDNIVDLIISEALDNVFLEDANMLMAEGRGFVAAAEL